MYGYHRKVLIINLSTESVSCEPLSKRVLKHFIGGIGLGTYLLYKHCPEKISGLDPRNPIIFVTSPLVGTRLTTSSKFAVVTKSPLTGFIGDSLSSSFLATEIKKTGYDALVIKGKCNKLTLLSITEKGVEFLDAQNLCGLSTSETEKAVKVRLGQMNRVACIGPAGENQILFASISNDGGRQAGRTGSGAVMGSKNLKAISVRGHQQISIFQPDDVERIGKDLTERSLGPATEKYRKMGTLANISVFNRLWTLPTRNFQQATFENAENISAEKLHQTHIVKNAHCANCTIGCEQIISTNDKEYETKGRLEYESSFALGSLLGIADPNAVIRASNLCDELGMDTISAGATIAWAMECFENGVLKIKDTSGVILNFGSVNAVFTMLNNIAYRKGLGRILADGTRIASQKIGCNSNQWAMHVKGLEMPGYEPRSLKTMALGLAVSPRGACHNRSSNYESDFSNRVDRFSVDESRGQITAEGEDFSAILDSLIWCKFLRKAFTDLYAESSEIYQHVTGFSITVDELRKSGERINNLKKLFNIREGWKRKDDTLPNRILSEKLPIGNSEEVSLTRKDLDIMISSYYMARGWNKNGTIPKNKINELNLTDIIKIKSAS